jgi:hypothetical protein
MGSPQQHWWYLKAKAATSKLISQLCFALLCFFRNDDDDDTTTLGLASSLVLLTYCSYRSLGSVSTLTKKNNLFCFVFFQKMNSFFKFEIIYFLNFYF